MGRDPVRITQADGAGLESAKPYWPLSMYSAPTVGSWFVHSTRYWAEVFYADYSRAIGRVRPHIEKQGGRAGIEPAKPCTPHRQSSVSSNCCYGIPTRDCIRVTTASYRLLHSATLLQNGAGGTRTRILRGMIQVLQHGSRDVCIMFLVKRRFSKCKNVADEVFVRDYLCAVACFATVPEGTGRIRTGKIFWITES